MSITNFNLVSPGEGVVRIDYFDGRYVCEQISQWLMKKIPNSIILVKSPSTESRILKRNFSPFTRSTSNTYLAIQK